MIFKYRFEFEGGGPFLIWTGDQTIMSRLLWPTELMGLKRKHFTFKYFFRQAKNALNTKLCNDKVEFNNKNVLFIEKLML